MAHPSGRRPPQLKKSVVKVFTVIKEPNYYQPWDFGYQSNSGGSGCIIEGRRILTNAHVVANQVYVQVLKAGDMKRYTARVLHVDHGSECALLTVDDDQFFEGVIAAELGELPEREDVVAAYGFPVGGNEMSITEGVVSRIEVRGYTHSQRGLLAIQTDAAINPGNSGGPVFHDDKLIGIAFQFLRGKAVEKSGYIVPVPVIRHFLEDVEDGVVQGVPTLGCHWQCLENDALRAYLGMAPDQTGILITRVVEGSAAASQLEEQDVLTHIADEPVANNGSVLFRDDDRVGFTFLISRCHVGDSLELGILRGGRPMTVRAVLGSYEALVPRPRYDVRATYLIFAGVVFTPLTYNYMKVWEWKDVEARFRHEYAHGLPTNDRQEVVLINQVLAHDINAGYHHFRNVIVTRVNDVSISRMSDLLDAFAAPLDGFHVIELDAHAGRSKSNDVTTTFGTRLVLPVEGVESATVDVLDRYGIEADRSRDLARD